ncbi:MAG: hypothetical protein J6H20_08130 [Pyramidobacter sp.]|nr:hypothetical protein [Pyramidobacter sp.]MBP3752579.1 hypothetical protein [Pyramidobacter sp.]
MDQFKSGDFCFQYDENWGKELAPVVTGGFRLSKVSEIAVDNDNQVYLFTRSDIPIIVAGENGNFIRTIGNASQIGRAHGMLFDSKGAFWCVDDYWSAVYKMDMNGNILQTLGTPKQHSGTDVDWIAGYPDYRTIRQAAGPFCGCTAIAEAPNGDFYITDGYGNAKVHRYSASGEYICSWGEPGIKPGQFFLPHGIYISEEGVIHVCDRENNRIQRFDLDGTFIDEWTGLIRPSSLRKGDDGLLYLCECKRCDVFDAAPSRLSILTPEGKLLARFENDFGAHPDHKYHCGHSIAVDHKGSVYIGEVGIMDKDYIGIKKYIRV